MKIVIAPDSFKGTMSAAQVCAVVAQAARERLPGCEVVEFPVADGGEGSVDCLLACLPGEKVWITAKNLFMEDMQAYYGRFGDSSAIVETAACAGLPLAEGRKNPLIATTFGVGQLILDASRQGARKILVGLGGSATNDGGCGAAAACGIAFRNASGERFVPAGGTLKDIDRIDPSGLEPSLRGVEITAMCDIDNPMFGPDGAAYAYAPQKGASEKEAALLDGGLRHLSKRIERDMGVDVSGLRGSGAAGAMGAGLAAFFRAELRSGIETVLDAAGFDGALTGADLVVTGEGRFDRQSLQGKAVGGIARRAAERGIPVVVVAGGAEPLPEAYARGVSAVFPINRLPEDFSVSRHKSEENLRQTADNIFRLIAAML